MLESRGEWVLFTDADHSVPIRNSTSCSMPSAPSRPPWPSGRAPWDRSLIAVHQSWFRETAGRIYNLLMGLVTGLHFADTHAASSSSRAPPRAKSSAASASSAGDSTPKFLFIARQLGYKTVEVPVRWSHSQGTKVSMFRDSLSMFLDPPAHPLEPASRPLP